MLYIPVPSDAPSEEEGDAVKEEETPTAAAAAAASFAVVLSNHLSLPGQYTPSSSKMVLRKLSDQVCRKRFESFFKACCLCAWVTVFSPPPFLVVVLLVSSRRH